jgi:hypothetical protein
MGVSCMEGFQSQDMYILLEEAALATGFVFVPPPVHYNCLSILETGHLELVSTGKGLKDM